MKLSTLALAAAALLAATDFGFADAATPAEPAASTAATPAAPDASTPAATAKTTDTAKEKHKKSASAAGSGPKSAEARCAAKVGQSVGPNKWEFKGDKAEKAYSTCLAKAD